jgi:hypothetical protein
LTHDEEKEPQPTLYERPGSDKRLILSSEAHIAVMAYEKSAQYTRRELEITKGE